MRIGCLGEVMLELVTSSDASCQLGVAGDTYNTSVYLARGALEGKVDYITILGKDGYSDRIRAHMDAYSVGTSRVLTHPNRHPGLYAIETDDEGERSFTYWRTEAAVRSLGEPDFPSFDQLFEGLSHVYYSGISLAILTQENRDRLFAALAAFRANGGIVAFDSNYRPNLWNDKELAQAETTKAWSSCDIGLPSVDDEMYLFEDASEDDVLERFQGYGIAEGALKRGAQGPITLDGIAMPTDDTTVKVVDTTAAGDSFNAGYLSACLSGQNQMERMKAGHDLAKQVIGQRGAIIF